MEEEMEPTGVQTPMVVSPEKSFGKLKQITVKADDEIEEVNKLLSDGWRLVGIGYRPDATVYVVGQLPDKPKARAGFGFARGAVES